jgi:hypothetical protein
VALGGQSPANPIGREPTICRLLRISEGIRPRRCRVPPGRVATRSPVAAITSVAATAAEGAGAVTAAATGAVVTGSACVGVAAFGPLSPHAVAATAAAANAIVILRISVSSRGSS